MRSRSWINLVLLLAVAVVATAIFLLHDDRLEPAPLTPIAPEAVTTFEVHDATGRVMTVEEGAAGWRMVEPFERPAHSARIVRSLSFLDDRLDACYAANAERLTEFGLDDPRLTLSTEGIEVHFGDRAQDGRRYVHSGERACLIDDIAYPLLNEGPIGIAVRALLPSDAMPVAIRTPAAEATDPDGDGNWSFDKGSGAGQRWSARWRSANAEAFVLSPPEDDYGEIEIRLTDGAQQRWRIASPPDKGDALLLVPHNGEYGLQVDPADAAGLLEPPERVEDGLN